MLCKCPKCYERYERFNIGEYPTEKDHKCKKKHVGSIFLFCLTILLTLSLLAAVPPFVQTSSNGCQAESLKINIIKFNQSHEFNLHVLNTSDGKPLNINQINCSFHLYDDTGEHIYLNDTANFYQLYDFEYRIPANNFTKIGYYKYIFTCNNTYEGCFVSGDLQTTISGLNPAGDNLLIFFFLLFTIVVASLIYVLIMNVTKIALIETSVYDVALSWTVYFVMIIAYWLATLYSPTLSFMNFLGVMLYVAAFTHVILPIISLVLTIFIKGTQKKKPAYLGERY